MKKMPFEIKQKLRALENVYEKASRLENEVKNIIESYGVDCDYLTGTSVDRLPCTEALAYITNAEGAVEDSIREIEEVFLWHINNHAKY